MLKTQLLCSRRFARLRETKIHHEIFQLRNLRERLNRALLFVCWPLRELELVAEQLRDEINDDKESFATPDLSMIFFSPFWFLCRHRHPKQHHELELDCLAFGCVKNKT